MPLKRTTTFAAIFAGALLLGPTAMAQTICWRQPWTRPSASFESRVVQCPNAANPNPSPLNRVAMDDFITDDDCPIVRVHWWGTLDHPGQANRPFYIAFYKDNGNCEPEDQPDGSFCVQPRAKYISLDCEGRRVFRFSAKLPAPFTAIAGDRYWIQISEADEESIRPNIEDFRWSSHRPIRECPAVQRDATGGLNSPLLDACDDREEDLAFILFSRSVVGTIVVPNVLPPVFVLQLFPAGPLSGDSQPSETLVVEPDENGDFDIAPSLPDGTYNWRMYGMSMRPETGQVSLTEGEETSLGGPLSGGAIEPGVGDTDSDGAINVNDLLRLLASWG